MTPRKHNFETKYPLALAITPQIGQIGTNLNSTTLISNNTPGMEHIPTQSHANMSRTLGKECLNMRSWCHKITIFLHF